MASDISVGDLVCYNAAGQKKKTLGLVLDIRKDMYANDGTPCVLIQWCCIGNGLLPRKASISWDAGRRDIGTGSIVWHMVGDWFEVVK